MMISVLVVLMLSGCSGGEETSVVEPMEGIDIDLSQMNEMLAYAEACSIAVSPEAHVGKMVRMTGEFVVDGLNEPYLFACQIEDATGCCFQALAFELEGDYTYPDDYPKKGSTITVMGELSISEENQQVILKNAVIN